MKQVTDLPTTHGQVTVKKRKPLSLENIIGSKLKLDYSQIILAGLHGSNAISFFLSLFFFFLKIETGSPYLFIHGCPGTLYKDPFL